MGNEELLKAPLVSYLEIFWKYYLLFYQPQRSPLLVRSHPGQTISYWQRQALALGLNEPCHIC